MSNQQTRGRLLAGTVLAGMAFMGFSAPAMAQTPAPAQPAAAEGEEIVVTGSRIARQDFVANSPVSTITAADIQATGNINTEELLNVLPQVVPGLTAASNNPSNGTATVDLRGLGASRTLVLVNGRRFNPAERNSVVDLNSIPAALIERVEVVTGGASAVYGSDALGGVVNFILKNDFQGLEFNTQYGRSEVGDGEQYTLSATIGTDFDGGKGNVTAFVGYSDRDRILSTAREWSRRNAVSGSATGTARFDAIGANPFRALGGNTITGNAAFRAGGGVVGAQNVLPPAGVDPGLGQGDRYDFNPVNNILSPAERVNFAILGKYDIAPWAQFYTEAFVVDSRNSAQLAPTPMVGAVVPATNPFLTAASTQALINSRPTPGAPLTFRRRMIEVGARVERRDSDLYRFTAGLRGDLPFAEGWDYDLFVATGRTEFNIGIENDVSRSKVQASLNATSISSCGAAVLAIFPGCVPVNYFGPPGSITPAQANFIRLNFLDETLFEQNVVGGSVSGDLFQLPAGALKTAFGFEYREDRLNYTPSSAKATGDIFGFNAERPVAGNYNVNEFFGEALVPLVKDAPFAKYLGLELGVRYSDYSSVGGLTTYKAGGEWEVVDGLRFRGMYQKASRAPNVFELFQQGDQGFPQVTDPCATSLLNGTTRTLSAATNTFCTTQLGFSPNAVGFAQTNQQIEAFFFGNPRLQEENSDTVTLGGVWSPTFIPGLNLTVDYYDISVEDYVNTLGGGPSAIVAACFASGSLTSSACFSSDLGQPLIFRDGAGELKVRAPLVNVSALETSGVDVGLDYTVDLSGMGLPSWMGPELRFNAQVSYLDSWILDGTEYKGAVGTDGNVANALPEWRGNFRVGYDLGPVALAWNINWIGDALNRGDVDGVGTNGLPIVGEVDNTFYHDLQARWSLNKTVEIFGGVQNIGDKEPPQLGFGGPDGNTDPNTYDGIGRYLYAGAKLKF